MASSVARLIQGFDTQGMWFWLKAADLFLQDNVEAVGYEVDDAGEFAMFRRLKLHLAPLTEQSLTRANGGQALARAKRIEAVLELTDPKGRPVAASVRPPWVTWRVTAGGRSTSGR